MIIFLILEAKHCTDDDEMSIKPTKRQQYCVSLNDLTKGHQEERGEGQNQSQIIPPTHLHTNGPICETKKNM